MEILWSITKPGLIFFQYKCFLITKVQGFLKHMTGRDVISMLEEKVQAMKGC